MEKYCPRCGNSLQDSVQVCQYCGYTFPSSQPNTQPQTPPPTYQPLPTQPPSNVGKTQYGTSQPNQPTGIPQPSYSYRQQPVLPANYIQNVPKQFLSVLQTSYQAILSTYNYAKLIVGISVILFAVGELFPQIELIISSIRFHAYASIAPATLLIASFLIYLVVGILFLISKNFSLNRLIYPLSLLYFLILGITEMVATAIATGTGYFPGVILVTGSILGFFAIMKSNDKITAYVIGFVSVLLIYIYSNSFLNSNLWGPAVLTVLSFLIVMTFVDMRVIRGVGWSISALILSIGFITFGSSLLSVSNPGGYLGTAYFGITVASGILSVIGGVFGIVCGIFMIIFSLITRETLF
ncbi:hypothetical protein HS7_10190 [Sulfolobales archaeon HS-7]|nr:hypothetical protein HS7_10190 [Sulfolobales archaeon HS-7]